MKVWTGTGNGNLHKRKQLLLSFSKRLVANLSQRIVDRVLTEEVFPALEKSVGGFLVFEDLDEPLVGIYLEMNVNLRRLDCLRRNASVEDVACLFPHVLDPEPVQQ